jgi:protein-S-isoprenylcysteine O-methyltransferase Ste14
MKEIIRHILGYIFGITVFIILIPLGLYELSKLDYLVGYRALFNAPVPRYLLSFLFFLIGITFALWSNIFLLMVGKGGPVDGLGITISPRTKKLVTSGPYRLSRNPMVFGAFSIYTSVVIYLNSIMGLAGLVIMFILAILYLRYSEEKRLIRDFGSDYLEYRKKVSMIFPVTRLRK